jgi:hypothetical protein
VDLGADQVQETRRQRRALKTKTKTFFFERGGDTSASGEGGENEYVVFSSLQHVNFSFDAHDNLIVFVFVYTRRDTVLYNQHTSNVQGEVTSDSLVPLQTRPIAQEAHLVSASAAASAHRSAASPSVFAAVSGSNSFASNARKTPPGSSTQGIDIAAMAASQAGAYERKRWHRLHRSNSRSSRRRHPAAQTHPRIFR